MEPSATHVDGSDEILVHSVGRSAPDEVLAYDLSHLSVAGFTRRPNVLAIGVLCQHRQEPHDLVVCSAGFYEPRRTSCVT
jgi:hypothetical protein